MMLVHRYVFVRVLFTCFGAVIMFSSLILIAEVLRDLVALLADGRLNAPTFLKLVSIIVPYVFTHALPMGMLTGVLLVMGRMSADSEFVALRSAGLSVSSICSSVIVLALLGVMVSLLVNFEYGPRARNEYRSELADTVRSNPVGFLLEKTHVKDFPGYIVYVGEKSGPELRDVWIWELDDQSRCVRHIRAVEGRFDFDDRIGEVRLGLFDGTLEYRDESDPENFRGGASQLAFEHTVLDLPVEFLVSSPSPAMKLYWHPFRDLLKEIERREERVASASGDESSAARELCDAKMAFHEKLAHSFAPLSLALIAIPLGIVTKRSETSANLFLALGLGLSYYIVMNLVAWTGSFYWLKPYLLFWLPNLLFQGVGMLLIYRIDNLPLAQSKALPVSSASVSVSGMTRYC